MAHGARFDASRRLLIAVVAFFLALAVLQLQLVKEVEAHTPVSYDYSCQHGYAYDPYPWLVRFIDHWGSGGIHYHKYNHLNVSTGSTHDQIVAC